MVQWLTNLTRNNEVAGSVPALAQWVKGSGIAMNCSVGCRLGSDPVLLWLWRKRVATALIRSQAWEPPNATGVAKEMTKRPKKKKFKLILKKQKE